MRIEVTSIVGLMTKEPYVQLQVPEPVVQLTPEEARDLAINILEASEAAQMDLFLMEFLTGPVGTDMDRAGMMLTTFREWRTERANRVVDE